MHQRSPSSILVPPKPLLRQSKRREVRKGEKELHNLPFGKVITLRNHYWTENNTTISGFQASIRPGHRWRNRTRGRDRRILAALKAGSLGTIHQRSPSPLLVPPKPLLRQSKRREVRKGKKGLQTLPFGKVITLRNHYWKSWQCSIMLQQQTALDWKQHNENRNTCKARSSAQAKREW
ncbi:hypothetical protein PoB_004786900 [Plakobranchus ocellatus]|uniref:Uncharacterized protein n=1 Tax=Plakobranchus ocellatus TaxID=259542 RepID=A0AAV4BML9_9GAST|nr:hypothetical protein PoB_004786900 [Plakobranchus ocellatus]